jgi:DNA-binding HxlR family transcriptional regulator
VDFALTPDGKTLSEVIVAMHKWEIQHRIRIIGKK